MIKREGYSIKTFFPIYLIPNWDTKLSASIKGLRLELEKKLELFSYLLP